MLYLATHTAFLALLAAVCWWTGEVLLEGWSGLNLRGRLRPLARWVLGLGAWIAALFLLAALGELHRPALLVLTAGIAAAALWRLRKGTARRRRRWRAPRRLEVLAGAALAAVLAPLYLLAMSPAVSWDASVYHLTLPKLYVEAGGFRPVPFNVYSNWPQNVELLFAAAILVEDYVLAKLIHFGFGLLTLWAIVWGCRGTGGREAARTSGWLAAALFLANGVVVYEFRVAYVDLAHAFFFLAGFLFLRESLCGGRNAGPALVLAGVCGGLMAGVKLNGVAGAAILATLYLPKLAAAWRGRELGAELRTFGLRYALPVAALWLPWLMKSALMTGNPIYPFVFGGPYWSPELGDALQDWQRSIGMGRDPVDYLLLPFRVALSGGPGYGRFDGELGAFWLAAVPAALWVARRRRLVRDCLVVAGLYFAFWALTSQQLRLLIPSLPLAAIACAVAIVELADRLPRWTRPAGRRWALAAGLLLAAWIGTEAAPGMSRSRFLGAAGKALSRYLEGGEDLKTSAVHPVYRYVNGNLPADAKLLFLNTNQRFFCDREVLADSFFEASQIARWLAPAGNVAELRALLSGAGVTHLLVEHRDRGIPYPPALFELLRDPGEVDVLYTSPEGRLTVLELVDAEAVPEEGG